MRNILKVLTLSDIHFGVYSNPERLMQELGIVFDYIQNNTLDMVVIVGDITDRKLTMNSKVAQAVYEFITMMILVCNKKGIMLRIIKGTASHDLDQLNVFESLQGKYFRLVQSVMDESITFSTIDKVCRFLYIPEEYPENYREYYKQYLFNGNKYDMVFFHGTEESQAFNVQKMMSERHIHAAPIFKYDELAQISIGPVIGGHIHTHMKIKSKLYYNGSFTRLNHAETESKGFLVTTMDMNSGIFNVEFIENTLAPTYCTIDMSTLQGDEVTKLNTIEKSKEEFDYVRVINIDTKDLGSEMIKNALKTTENLKLQNKKLSSEIIDRDPTYDFILKKELTLPEEVQRVIKINTGKTIPLDVTERILKNDDED